MPTYSDAVLDMTSPAASGRHLPKFEKRPKMLQPRALFVLNLMQCQRRLQNSRVKNIGNVFELSSVTFRPATEYCGLIVELCDCCPDFVFRRHSAVQAIVNPT